MWSLCFNWVGPRSLAALAAGVLLFSPIDAYADRKLDRTLKLLDTARTAPPWTEDRVAAEIVRGLNSGEYDSLVLGESHGAPGELAAGRRFIKDVLAAGVYVDTLLREENLFKETDFLDRRAIPVHTYRSAFRPAPDIDNALSDARPGIVISYTGHAHSATRVKDYRFWNLEESRGGRDMPTVEEAFKDHGMRPIIVAMLTENNLQRVAQRLAARRILKKPKSLAKLTARLESFVADWLAKFSRYPARPAKLFFARHPRQANLFIGITPADNIPRETLAILSVLRGPALAAWLGSDKIKMVESLYQSRGDGRGGVQVSYLVVVHEESGRRFKALVPASSSGV